MLWSDFSSLFDHIILYMRYVVVERTIILASFQKDCSVEKESKSGAMAVSMMENM